MNHQWWIFEETYWRKRLISFQRLSVWFRGCPDFSLEQADLLCVGGDVRLLRLGGMVVFALHQDLRNHKPTPATQYARAESLGYLKATQGLGLLFVLGKVGGARVVYGFWERIIWRCSHRSMRPGFWLTDDHGHNCECNTCSSALAKSVAYSLFVWRIVSI